MKDRIEYHRLSDTPGLIISDAYYSEFRFERHYHLDYHIGLVVDGVQRQCFQGQSVLLGPGRISIMPPGEIHDGQGYDQNEYRMKTFRVSAALLAEYFEDIFETPQRPGFAGAMVEDSQIAARLSELHSGIWQSASLSSLAAEERWLDLMAPLFARLCRVKPVPVAGGLSVAHWGWVEEYCREHLSERISLEELAGLCGLSRYQLLRRFEKTTGMTPKAWLIRLRLEHACSLLRGSNLSIADIAAQVGFYDQSHFNRAFRSAYGVAPSRY